MYANIKYKGKIYRIQKLPYEPLEQVMDRGWFIINKINNDNNDDNDDNNDYDSVYAESLKWIHEKYIKVKYL